MKSTFTPPLLISALLAASAGPAGAEGQPKLDGTWTWTWKDGQGTTHKHVLEVTGGPDKPAIRERFDEEAAVKVTDLKRDGEKVRFSVVRGGTTSNYAGSFSGDATIEGKVVVTRDGQTEEFTWTARRKPLKP